MRARTITCLLALALISCSDGDATREPAQRTSDPGGDLTLASRGGASLEVARRRIPQVTVLRAREGLLCQVRWDAEDRPAWVELAGRKRWDLDVADNGEMVSITLAPGTAGMLVFRAGYADGEMWRRTISL